MRRLKVLLIAHATTQWACPLVLSDQVIPTTWRCTCCTWKQKCVTLNCIISTADRKFSLTRNEVAPNSGEVHTPSSGRVPAGLRVHPAELISAKQLAASGQSCVYVMLVMCVSKLEETKLTAQNIKFQVHQTFCCHLSATYKQQQQ